MKLKALPRPGELTRNVTLLTGGTVIASLINFAISPVHSRIFDTEDFAIFGVFTSIITLFLVFSNLRLEQAIPLPAAEEEAKSIAKNGLKASVVVALLSALCVAIFHVVQISRGISFNPLVYLCVPTLLVMGTVQILNFYSIRKKTFKFNSIGRIIGASTGAALTAWLGWTIEGPFGLLFGFFLGQTAIMIWMQRHYLQEILSHTEGEFNWPFIRKKYKTLIIINSIHAVVDTFELAGVIFVLEYFFPAGPEVGLFFFSYRMMKMPLNMVGAAIYQVLFQKMSESIRKNQSVRPLILSVYKKLFLLSIVPFVIIFFYGGDIFAFVFGDKWYSAGLVSSILVPWMLVNFVASPLSSVALIFNKQQYAFIIAVIGTILRLSVCVYGGIIQDFAYAMLLLSIVSTMQMLFFTWWYYFISGSSSSPKN